MPNIISSSVIYRGNKSNNIADVKTLQYDLFILGYIHESGIDGIFGAKTEVAVKDIQQRYNNLNNRKILVDGKVSGNMWAILVSAVDTTPQLGSTLPAVHKLSKYLVWAGLLTNEQDVLDKVMVSAIKKFQAKNGLYQTGNLNSKTIEKLVQVRQTQLKAIESQIILREVMNGEINHETKPVIFSTGLFVAGSIWLIWLLNSQKKAHRMLKAV